MSDNIKLFNNDKSNSALIDRGELVGFTINEIETMHQKGDAGWGNTEIEMFPIIGATRDNDFSVPTSKGNAKLDQHGILRAMNYTLKTNTSHSAVFHKIYKANTKVLNPKYPKKSTQQWLDWPFDFEFIKTFELIGKSLKISFEIHTNEEMPFMLGFHPAFKIYNQKAIVETKEKSVTIEDVLNAGASAYLLENNKEIILKNNGDIELSLKTKGFRHIMLWTEVTNMLCIEPITFYPASVKASELYTGFDHCSGYQEFEVLVTPILV